jgi:aspartate ammonia-lyase
VIPEAVTQVAMQVIGRTQTIATACAAGSLELNAFLPLIADELLNALQLLAGANDILRRHAIEGMEADEAACRAQVEASTATVTALVPLLGYERAAEIAATVQQTGRTVRQVAVDDGHLSSDDFEQAVSPEAVCRLGST